MTDGPVTTPAPSDATSVLVVDDEAEFRTTLCKVLARRGFDVGAAGDGAEALRRLGERPWDVMVLDLRMPGLDGLATLREARRLGTHAQVIILTGHGTAEAGIQAMRGHAFDFLFKPVRVDDLVDVIEAAAEQCRAAPQPGR
jgi:DNA-binding NtrC family response regulator